MLLPSSHHLPGERWIGNAVCRRGLLTSWRNALRRYAITLVAAACAALPLAAQARESSRPARLRVVQRDSVIEDATGPSPGIDESSFGPALLAGLDASTARTARTSA